jgi:hypothetical protein
LLIGRRAADFEPALDYCGHQRTSPWPTSAATVAPASATVNIDEDDLAALNNSDHVVLLGDVDATVASVSRLDATIAELFGWRWRLPIDAAYGFAAGAGVIWQYPRHGADIVGVFRPAIAEIAGGNSSTYRAPGGGGPDWLSPGLFSPCDARSRFFSVFTLSPVAAFGQLDHRHRRGVPAQSQFRDACVSADDR